VDVDMAQFAKQHTSHLTCRNFSNIASWRSV